MGSKKERLCLSLCSILPSVLKLHRQDGDQNGACVAALRLCMYYAHFIGYIKRNRGYYYHYYCYYYYDYILIIIIITITTIIFENLR
jgi:hypothetical protein